MHIRTNHHDRQFVYRHDVPPAVLESEFDWLGEDDGSDHFILYRGDWMHLSQFERAPPGADELDSWDGYAGDSYSTGTQRTPAQGSVSLHPAALHKGGRLERLRSQRRAT